MSVLQFLIVGFVLVCGLILVVGSSFYSFYRTREIPTQRGSVDLAHAKRLEEEELIAEAAKILAGQSTMISPMPVATATKVARRTAEFRDRIAAEAKQRSVETKRPVKTAPKPRKKVSGG